MYLDLLEWIDWLLLSATYTILALIAIGVSAYLDVPYTGRIWWFIQRCVHGLL